MLSGRAAGVIAAVSRGRCSLALRDGDVEEDDREGIVERRLAKDEVVQERRGAHVLEDAEGGDGVCG